MPVGNITGLSSGLQWADTVELLMNLERRPVESLTTRKTTFQSQLTNWGAIESRLSALKTASEAADAPDELLAKSIKSSDSDILSASGDSTAITGTHDVLVNQLATNAVIVHKTGWADADTTEVNDTGSDRKFSINYGGEDYTFTIPDASTLTDLVNIINNDPDNPGVTASILNDGSGGATAYHIVLSGKDSGEENTISIIDTVPNPTNLGTGTEFDAAEWDETQAAQNAEIRVDGFPDPSWGWANPWIESDSNAVTDVIPGVTINLKDVETTTPVKIEISLDKAAAKAKVDGIIKSYNEVISTMNTLTSYNTETNVAGPLASDAFARSLRSELNSFLASNIPGTSASDRFRSLGEVGVEIGSGGVLSLDSTKFNDALDTDATAVARLFVFDSTSSSSFVSVAGHSDSTIGGQYAFNLAYDASGVIDTGGVNEIGGEDAILHGSSLLGGATGTDAEGMLVLLSNPGNGPSSITGNLTIYTGLASLLTSKINEITDSENGRIALTRDRINDSIDNLDERIDAWTLRLKTVEDAYTRRFSAMETLVGQLKTQSSYLAGGLG